MADADKLMESGYQALGEEKWEEAVRIAEKLRALRHTSCFEIAACAEFAMKQHDKAIATLREGLEIAPQLWLLWDYLGCFLSDLGRYPEAEEALRRGMECEDAPRNQFLYNVAVVFERADRVADALAVVDSMIVAEADEPSVYRIEALRARLLEAAGQFDRAQALVEKTSHALQAHEEQLGDDDLAAWSQILCVAGKLALRASGAHGDALEHLMMAVTLDSRNATAFTLIREITAEKSAGARLLRILVHGRVLEKHKGKTWGFYRNYDVIADTPEDALGYASAMEEGETTDLKVEESTDLGPHPDECMGIVSCDRRRVIYPLERPRKGS